MIGGEYHAFLESLEKKIQGLRLCLLKTCVVFNLNIVKNVLKHKEQEQHIKTLESCIRQIRALKQIRIDFLQKHLQK